MYDACHVKQLEYRDFSIAPAATNRAWYGMEWKMEWNGNFGMEYGRCQNGMEYGRCQNGMEDNLPYFHTNSILDLCIVFTEKYIPMSGSDK